MAILGLATIYSMTKVYQLRAVPGWNGWRTPLGFLLSTAALGALGMRLFIPIRGLSVVTGIALLAELGLGLARRIAPGGRMMALRLIFVGLGILGASFLAIGPGVAWVWMAPLLLFVTLVEEALGRWQFYALRVPFPMQK